MTSMSRVRAVGALTAVAIVSLLGSNVLAASPGLRAAAAGSDDFYTVPQDLSGYQPGDLIKSEPVTDLVTGLRVTRATRVMYRSTDGRGRAIAVTGMVFAPSGGVAPAAGWPVVSFAHGTTGVGDACAPSKHRNLYWDVYAWLVARLVRDGFVVVATDYEGLGTPGLHPWLELDSGARATIDAVPAARTVVPAAGLAWAVVGHSEGGHAALGAAELAHYRQAAGLTFVGAVSLAPGSQLKVLAARADSPDFGWDLLAFAAASIRAGAPSFEYSDLLLPPLLDEMPRAETTCEVELFRYLVKTYPGDLSGLRPDFLENESVNAWFERNEPGRRPAAGPILLMQGSSDLIVPVWATNELAATLCAGGALLDYRVYNGANHDALVYRGYPELGRWLRARFDGVPAASTCAAR